MTNTIFVLRSAASDDAYAVYLNGRCFLYANAARNKADNQNTANIVARNIKTHFGGMIYHGRIKR